MENCEIVTKMIEVINERGWCKHYLRNSQGEVCIRGAFGIAVNDDPYRIRGIDEVEKDIRLHIPGHFRTGAEGVYNDDVVEFNNAKETTKEDVLDVLGKTKEAVC